MLNSFYVRNFRLFERLFIEKLGQINLITGKNNSGKSSLLEALYLYAKDAHPSALFELVSNREEDWETQHSSGADDWSEFKTPFRHLFHGYELPEIGKESIEIGDSEEPEKTLKLHVSAYQTVEKNGYTVTQKVNKESFESDDIDISSVDLFIELEESGSFRRLQFLEGKNRTGRTLTISNHQKYNVQYVTMQKLNSEVISHLWDSVNRQPRLRREVFNGLKIIDNEIQEVVKIGGQHNAVFLLLYDDPAKQLALRSMGEGMSHLFHIILALVNARDGILLIDEFENGLHYEIQPKIWSLIFQLAEQLNVQVFATTHSRDTIYALKDAATVLGKENQTRFIKLKALQKAGVVKAAEFDFENLDLLLEQGIEVR